MGRHSPLIRGGRAVVTAALLALLGLAGAERSTLVAEDERAWRELLEIQARVPGFAGFVFGPLSGAGGPPTLQPLLVFPNLAPEAAAAIAAKFDFRVIPRAIPARHSARTLVGTARRIVAAQPSARPRVDLALNRVVVEVPESHLEMLAREWAVPRGHLVALGERPRFEERLGGTGRLTGGTPLEDQLRVQVRNPLNRPAVFESGCLFLQWLDIHGQPLPQEEALENVGFACSGRESILQPGETREFLAIPTRLNAPEAGDYLLKTERGEFLPLKVWPR